MAVSEVEFWASFRETSFIRIAGTLEAENLVCGTAECFLALGGDKKVSFLDRPSPLKLIQQRDALV